MTLTNTMRWMGFMLALWAGCSMPRVCAATSADGVGRYEPVGRLHVPIGVPDTPDTLKTFVEPEGGYSPGFASCGITFWVYDVKSEHLTAATSPGTALTYGFRAPGVLIPWTEWAIHDSLRVRSEVCQVARAVKGQSLQIVGANVTITNSGTKPARAILYAVVQPVGPAGAPLYKLFASTKNRAISGLDGPLLVSEDPPTGIAVPPPSRLSRPLFGEAVSQEGEVTSENSRASAALRYDIELAPGASRTLGFISPVLHGRKAAYHEWEASEDRQEWIDKANPNTGGDGQPQASPGLAYYRDLGVAELFAQSEQTWRTFHSVELQLPDQRWNESFRAWTAHIAMTFNEGFPDPAVINQPVSTRAGAMSVRALQCAGKWALAATAIDSFLERPFNGRPTPDADNPGEVLWMIAEQWRFTHDKNWLARVWPKASRLAQMIAYLRTTEPPHWVAMDRLAYGTEAPQSSRVELRRENAESAYTEAWDIAGMGGAAEVARALAHDAESTDFNAMAEGFASEHAFRFGESPGRNPATSDGLLWPCRVYPPSHPKMALLAAFGAASFADLPGPDSPERPLEIIRAHQALLVGNRQAGFGSIENAFTLAGMPGWYLLGDHGKSTAGIWERCFTHWPLKKPPLGQGRTTSVAMPHGWSSAELQLLMRDSLAFEEESALVLFAGVPESWFEKPMHIKQLPTHFGPLTLEWQPKPGGGTITINESCNPPKGFILRGRRDVRIEKTSQPVAVQSMP